MKDITDYLCSPKNTSEAPNSVVLKDKKESTASKSEIIVQNSDESKSVNVKKRRKRKSKRKPSDPTVKNIAELLSNSLCIISPNTSLNDQSKSQKQSSEHKENEAKIVENRVDLGEIVDLERDESSSCVLLKDETSSNMSGIGIDKNDNNSSKSTNKLNAFQFMMESRNKSIGQNSPGKDRPTDDSKTTEEKEHKEVLSARKNIFQNWSDKKGAVKRKREEEEKEEMIKHKLQKRAKRLKQLLKADKPKDAEEDVIVKKRTKRIRRISTSSSENSKGSVIVQDSSEVLTDSVLEVVEENAQDRVLNTPKAKESKQVLLNFFGVVNKARKSEEINGEGENLKQKEKSKTKSKLSKSKRKSKISVNESVNKSITEESSSVELISVKSVKQKKDTASQESVSKRSKSPKTPKNRSKDDGDSNFTPRSLKSWKMKIKISDENSENVQNETETKHKRPQRSKRISDYKLLLSEESSNEGEVRVSRRRKTAMKSETDEVIVCSDDDSDKKKKETPKPLKVAPVFAKATPKPKLAPEVVEARKQFLMSGIPESLKKTIEKQQSAEEREYDIFPSISHVQQKCETQNFWSLPNTELDLKECSPLKIEKPIMCASVTNSRIVNKINIQKEVEKVDKLKTLLNKIKLDNPNYPVYKSFRLICEKSGKTFEKKKNLVLKHKKGRKNRSKSLDKSVEIIENIKLDTDSTEHIMWTDKYKPKCSDDIIGNSEGVKNLKKWLEFWKTFGEEAKVKKRKHGQYSSDSEFDTTDCDSRDSTKLRDNTVVVGGPCGSGKSTAIYAICTELDFNVIELNASSKRTGKRLLQELQEATQSHQVRKKKQNFFESNKEEEQTDKKMCVLLIEDVDIVFEQDDGFISALSQLVSSSKRPIILTTTDTSSVFAQKFITQYQYISFLPLSSQSLATWLQIVCLVEGLFVNQGDIGSLLEFNKGDARKTLLQLQFWVQSGGQIVREDLPVKTRGERVVSEQKLLEDEQEPCLEEETNETQEVFVHSDCIRSFEIFKHHKSYRVPYYLNLGLLWWNIPNILGIQSFSADRIKKFKENHIEIDKTEETPSLKKKLLPVEKQKLDSLSKLYDSLAFTDVSFRIVGNCSNLEPSVKNYSSTIKDSLELGEILDGFDGHSDFVHEMTHSLVNGCIEDFNSIEENETVLNVAVPEKAERRWRAKMHVCEDVFLEALPLSAYVERRSVALDYMPMLRNISRSESHRAANNTKRGNRFRNYLHHLGINYNHNTVKLACNILIMDDF